jgi:hypothetical protein
VQNPGVADGGFGSDPERLAVSTTSPTTADIGADIDIRRFGPED